MDTLSKISYEIEYAIDRHSKKLISSNIELLLDYCLRFYDRQFHTRDSVNKGFIEQFDIKLKDYLYSDKPHGGWFVGVGLLGVDDGTYWAQMQSQIDWREDVLNGVIKSAVFGVVCTWIAIFQGYDCVPTSEGVSRATTRTVVHSSLAVLGLDFVLTALMFGD